MESRLIEREIRMVTWILCDDCELFRMIQKKKSGDGAGKKSVSGLCNTDGKFTKICDGMEVESIFCRFLRSLPRDTDALVHSILH